MAEASVQVYGLVVIVGALLGYLLVSLRQNRFRIKKVRLPNFPSKHSFVYGLIGSLMLIIGFYLVSAGILLMTLTDINLTYLILPEPDLTLTDPKDKWIVNSTYTILKGVKAQSLESKHSDGLGLLGIGIGMMLASIPILWEFWKIKNEMRKTLDFLITDLEEINNKLVTVIHTLQNTLNDLNGNGNFITNLIRRTVPPVLAFGTLTAGVYFHRWELYVSHLREFGLTDPKIINQFHGFVLEFNKQVEPNENYIVSEVMNILNSGNPTPFQQLQTLLIPTLTDNLSKYQNLYSLLHREMDKISWIPNQSWRKP